MITRLCYAVVLLVVCAHPFFAQAETETLFHIAAGGDDNNTGTEAAPFSSIERAQQAVREKIAAGLTGDVRVLIHAGTYELGKPLVFTPLDSGTAQYSITYAAVSNETVVVSGGHRITNWTKGDGHVWTAQLPEVKDGRWYFRNLYVNGRRATRARSPSANDPVPWYTLKRFDTNTWAMTLGTGQVAAWKNLSDVEIVLRGQWTTIRKRIRSADPATATLIVEPPYIPASGFALGIGAECFLENARAFLNQPGEWYLDRASGVLSYWPRSGENLTTAQIIAPCLTNLMEVCGTSRQPVENLHFIGLRFYHAEGTLPPQGFIGSSYGLCRILYRMDEAVWLKFARSCSVKDGELAHVGANALYFDIGCSQCLVHGNRIYDVGDTGITVGGFARSSPTAPPLPSPEEESHSNQVVNNEILDCGATYFEGPAVFIRFASQTLVTHNSIHDCPSYAIHMGTLQNSMLLPGSAQPPDIASENCVRNNDIHHVCQMMNDTGPMFVWGIQTTNNVISGNVIHDTRAYGAIYFDNDSCAYRVEQNLIYNIYGNLTVFTGCRPEWFEFRDNYWNGTNAYVRSKFGHALAFGSREFPDLPLPASPESSQMSVEAWVNLYKAPAGSAPRVWLLGKNVDESIDGSYSLVASNNNVGASLNIGGGRENCHEAWSSSGPLRPGSWHLLAMTYDGTNLNVFCDGALAGSATVSRQRTTGSGSLRLGKMMDRYNPTDCGLIQAIRVYSRALSAEELSAHFSSTFPPVSQPSRVEPKSDEGGALSSQPSSLVLDWNANDAYATAPTIKQIQSKAGLEEPYRSRFPATRKKESLFDIILGYDDQ